MPINVQVYLVIISLLAGCRPLCHARCPHYNRAFAGVERRRRPAAFAGKGRAMTDLFETSKTVGAAIPQNPDLADPVRRG
jgi:hypothetical protein